MRAQLVVTSQKVRRPVRLFRPSRYLNRIWSVQLVVTLQRPSFFISIYLGEFINNLKKIEHKIQNN